MARSSEKVGRGPCPSCGDRVTFHRTKGGLLNYECYGCDQSGYAHKGGKSEAEWLATIDRTPVGAAAVLPMPPGDPANPPLGAPAPAPPPAAKRIHTLLG